MYASLVTTIYGVGTAHGLNERGLGARLLFLTATDFGPRDAQKPDSTLSSGRSTCSTARLPPLEALDLLGDVQIATAEARGARAIVHLALEDADGDSAIVEYIGGERVVDHGSEFRVMTNDPPYDQQLALLQGLDSSASAAATCCCRATWRHRPLPRAPATTRRCCRSPGTSAKRWPACSHRAQRRVPSGRLQGLRHLQHRVSARCRTSPTPSTPPSSPTPHVVWADLASRPLPARRR